MASSASLAETNLPATWPEALFLVPRANGLADLPHSIDSCLSRKACERAAATASASECGKHANGHVANIAERRVIQSSAVEESWLFRAMRMDASHSHAAGERTAESSRLKLSMCVSWVRMTLCR